MRPETPALISVTLGVFRNGRGDPTTWWDGVTFWRATWTPAGPGTVSMSFARPGEPLVTTYGSGGPWLAERVDDLLGRHDVIPELSPRHEAVVRAQRSWGAVRLGRSHTPYHELLPAVLGQRVTGGEAAAQWRTLVNEFGPVAPGPHPTLRLPPDPEVLARVPYHRLHRYGVERRRAETVGRVASAAHWLIAEHPGMPAARTAALTRIDGVGTWTAAVAGCAAFGDPDALQIGDFHVKNTVSWALRGVIRGTDEEMIEELRPYHGQRHRVVRWLELDGWRAPRRGPGRRNVAIARL